MNPQLSIFSVLLIGFFLGLQHAVESDHLAAISTIVSEKKSLITASLVGGLWGIGHSLSLFFVGVFVIVLKVQLSESVEVKLEAVVGGMLILLGLNALRKFFTAPTVHIHSHEHGEREHVHIHRHDAKLAEGSHHRLSLKSVAIGMVHGLAGSAALMLLILPSIGSPAVGFLYILIFGLGSIGGMMAMSFLIGLPFHFTVDRFTIINKGIRLSAAVFSLCLGFYIVVDKLARV